MFRSRIRVRWTRSPRRSPAPSRSGRSTATESGHRGRNARHDGFVGERLAVSSAATKHSAPREIRTHGLHSVRVSIKGLGCNSEAFPPLTYTPFSYTVHRKDLTHPLTEEYKDSPRPHNPVHPKALSSPLPTKLLPMATMMQKVLAPFHHHSSSSTQSQNTRSLTQSQSKRSPSPPSPSTKRPSSPSAKLPKYAVGDTVVVLDTFRNMQTVKITEILEPCPNNVSPYFFCTPGCES